MGDASQVFGKKLFFFCFVSSRDLVKKDEFFLKIIQGILQKILQKCLFSTSESAHVIRRMTWVIYMNPNM